MMSVIQEINKAEEYEDFSYLSEKILNVLIQTEPFSHILIEDFLSPEHFEMIINDPQVRLSRTTTTEELIDKLLDTGYVVKHFPGCTASIKQYLKCLRKNKWPTDNDMVEGFGIALRLQKYENAEIKKLIDYLNSQAFKSVLEQKFGVTRNTKIDTGIQKYLSGYEISPHPDIRSKCLTYLANINTSEKASELPIHTHLLKFKPEKEYIYSYWENNDSIDRCWVPWEWCTSEKVVSANNSLIMFQTHDRSLHAIKLTYDHKEFQRTQIYGNLWYTDQLGKPTVNFRQLEIKLPPPPGFFTKVKRKLSAEWKRVSPEY